MKSLWSIILVVLIACQCVNADGKDIKDPNDPNDPNYPSDPHELLRVKWNAVITVLQNKEIDQDAREKKINKIVNSIFDFPLMAKLALGREHWPKLTPPQREKFTRLFVERLRTSYREKISLYTDENVVFKPAVKNKSTVYIPMELKSGDKKVAILHKLRKVEKRWKVYDVEIQGISILLTYRSQFDDILSRGTVEDLLSRLEKRPTE
ncbi:MAG TPA: ABC transporter substrate-binding protein [Sedimentisphaerales bacterium]|nr:ABC transporter substrate-binding protein [Sedimentisphaerales bacterium]